MKKVYFIVCILVSCLLLVPTQQAASQANPFKMLFQEGIKAYAKGEYSKAIKIFEKTLDLYPNFAHTYYYLGLCKQALDTDLKEIAWLYKKTTDLDPNHIHAHFDLGKIYFSLQRFDESEVHLLRTLELNSELTSAKLAIAWVYLLGKSQPEDAVYYFEQVLDKYEIPFAYFGLGMAYFMDDQRYKTLGMITELKKHGKENLATQLEDVVRRGRYIPPKDFGSVLMIPKQRENTYIPDSYPEESELSGSQSDSLGSMKVRLKSRVSEPAQDEKSQAAPSAGYNQDRKQNIKRITPTKDYDQSIKKYGY